MREFLSSPDLAEISGIRGNLGDFGEIREISGKFRGTQWNSVGFCMALSMNSVRIPGKFRDNAGFSGKFGHWGGFGWLKGFCANSRGGGVNLIQCWYWDEFCSFVTYWEHSEKKASREPLRARTSKEVQFCYFSVKVQIVL